MTINLTVIRTPKGVNLNADEHWFGPDGGVIGRGTSADWVLDDPNRFLSSKHCNVLLEGGLFYVTDLSTNGTFLNGSSEPIGRGNRVAVDTGDQIDVGEYRFRVSIEADVGAGSGSPFDEPETANASSDVDLLGDLGAVPESMFMSSKYGGAVSDIAPDSMKITDPLLALDNADDPFVAPPAKKHESNMAYGSQQDSSDLLHEAADWPEVKSEPGVLPDDWDDDISLLVRGEGALVSHQLDDNDSLIAKAPAAKVQDPFAEPIAAAKSSAPRSVPPSAISRSAPKPKPRAEAPKSKLKQKPAVSARPSNSVKSSAGTQSANSSVTDTSLIEALGLGDADLSEQQVAHVSATVGAMMRETLGGLMQVLRSRASIKSEFRMNVTTIQPIENNPIKFSVNVDELLDTMFVRESNAYKKPIDAVRESLNSIADHQVAVIAGIRSAFTSALGQFDPLFLEEEFKKMGKGGLLPGFSSGKYWSAYQSHYQGLVNNMERTFQELFADEFAQAYEDQLLKLAKARKRGVK